MKKVLLPLTVILVTVSCTLSYKEEVPLFQSVEEACEWVSCYITYEENVTVKSIDEILTTRKGGCTAYAGLFMYIIMQQFPNKEVYLVGVHSGNIPHALVEIDGEWWEPQTGKIVAKTKYDLIKRYTFIEYQLNVIAYLFIGE